MIRRNWFSGVTPKAIEIPRPHERRLRAGRERRHELFQLLAVFAVLALSTLAVAQPLAPPEMRGDYNVGETKFLATMTGGRVTTIQVFYPTLVDVQDASQYTVFTPAGPYSLRSPLGAAHDAPVAPGPFPLVVYDHGGPIAGPDNVRLSQLSLHESMASNGFIVAVALHSSDAVIRVRDLPLVIDQMLSRSATDGDLLANSIDSARVGISGFSAGGAAAIAAAQGWSEKGLAADSRIKAMVVYEPGTFNYSPQIDAGALAMPYLIMGGTQYWIAATVPTYFNATVNSSPRYYVQNPNAVHFSYQCNFATEIEQTREAALLANPSIPEPLTTLIPSNPAAARAYMLWNQGALVFPGFGAGAGGGRNFCNRVGVNSIRSLDADGDGFTDSPLFSPTDAFTLAPPIPEEEMTPMVHLYTLSFWKAHLQGENRYRHFLTPGYAHHNNLKAVVTIE